jgi:excisionase family DNA binding protein
MKELTFNEMPEAIAGIYEQLNRIELLLSQRQGTQSGPTQSTGYITRNQVCKLLHITLPTVHSWMKSGKLKAYHVGGRTLFLENEVLQAVKPVSYQVSNND